MPGLRDILEAATRKPWVIHNYNEVWVHHDGDPAGPPATKVAQTIFGDDARLVALAPELAAGVLEAKDFAEEILCDEDIAKILMHDEGCERDDDPCPACALLARLDQLGKEQR